MAEEPAPYIEVRIKDTKDPLKRSSQTVDPAPRKAEIEGAVKKG